ncbi:AI-2E family transporter [Aquabacterium olei]|nr:AI-2E family transporter [Aquabacterium olei]
MEQPARPRLPEPSPPRSAPVVAFTRAEREVAPFHIPPGVVRLLGALLGLVLLREAAPILIPIAVAVALMFVLSGPVERLHRLGVPPHWGAGVVVTIMLTGVIGLGSVLARPAAQWAERAPTTVQQVVDTIERMRVAMLPPSRRAAQPLPTVHGGDSIQDKLATEGLLLTRVVFGQAMHFALQASATVILLYFLLASQSWLLTRTVEGVRRPRARALLLSGIRQARREIGLFLGTMGLINIGLGVVTGIALAFIGLPDPVLWGAVVAVLNFIPYLGPALVTVLLLLAGSMSFGATWTMLLPASIFLAGHAVEANLVSPWVMGRRLRLSPLSVFLSVMLWGWVWGFAGTLVAVPLLLGFRCLCQRRRGLRHICHYLEGGRSDAPSLTMLLRARERRMTRHTVRPSRRA